MSGLDPLAAYAAQVVANAQAAIEEAQLNLDSAILDDFRAQVNVGDVLTATVLPPQDGSDRISLLGQTITAQLPPGIHPGETLALQVTGFTNTAILVRNLGVTDPSQDPPQAPPLPQAPPGASQSAVLSRVQPQQPQAQQPAQQPQTQQPQAQTPPVAPPRELFVAASVKQSNAPLEVIVVKDEEAPTPPASVEARIVASRTSPVDPPKVPAPPSQPASAKTPATSAPSQPAPQGNVPLTTLLKKTLVPPVLVRPAGAHVQQAAKATSQAQAQAVAAQARANATPESALLARLRVPLSGTTLAAARLIDRAAQSVTATYQKLDELLAKVAPDERVSTLRAMLSFVSKIDMRNARAMPEQIASYVSNVVSGAESKIAQLVRAWSTQVALQAQESVAAETDAPQSPAQSGTSTTAQEAATPVLAQAAAPDASTAGIARAAERAVALEHDVKAALLQLVANPPTGASAQVVQALRDALTATTAAQLNTLNSQQQNPNAITIALPAYFHEDGRPAQIQISKDAGNAKNGLDADNFHIAFVLDTASLGTVAIDLQTVGRSVSLDVKTEGSRSASQFRASLPQLGERLEKLHYKVASMNAGVAERLAAQPPPAPVEASETSSSNLDMKA